MKPQQDERRLWIEKEGLACGVFFMAQGICWTSFTNSVSRQLGWDPYCLGQASLFVMK
jgi:hypothetical protein